MSKDKLPTTAFEWRYEDWEKGHTVLRHDEPENNFDVELSLEAELVRRSDVEQLIKERLQTQRKKVQDNNAFDRLNLNDAKARVDELQKLLKEVFSSE